MRILHKRGSGNFPVLVHLPTASKGAVEDVTRTKAYDLRSTTDRVRFTRDHREDWPDREHMHQLGADEWFVHAPKEHVDEPSPADKEPSEYHGVIHDGRDDNGRAKITKWMRLNGIDQVPREALDAWSCPTWFTPAPPLRRKRPGKTAAAYFAAIHPETQKAARAAKQLDRLGKTRKFGDQLDWKIDPETGQKIGTRKRLKDAEKWLDTEPDFRPPSGARKGAKTRYLSFSLDGRKVSLGKSETQNKKRGPK